MVVWLFYVWCLLLVWGALDLCLSAVYLGQDHKSKWCERKKRKIFNRRRYTYMYHSPFLAQERDIIMRGRHTSNGASKHRQDRDQDDGSIPVGWIDWCTEEKGGWPSGNHLLLSSYWWCQVVWRPTMQLSRYWMEVLCCIPGYPLKLQIFSPPHPTWPGCWSYFWWRCVMHDNQLCCACHWRGWAGSKHTAFSLFYLVIPYSFYKWSRKRVLVRGGVFLDPVGQYKNIYLSYIDTVKTEFEICGILGQSVAIITPLATYNAEDGC